MKFTKKEKCLTAGLPITFGIFLYLVGYRTPEFDPNLPPKEVKAFTNADRINFRLKQQKTIDFDKVDLSVSGFKESTWVKMAKTKGSLKKGSVKNKTFNYINWSDE